MKIGIEMQKPCGQQTEVCYLRAGSIGTSSRGQQALRNENGPNRPKPLIPLSRTGQELVFDESLVIGILPRRPQKALITKPWHLLKAQGGASVKLEIECVSQVLVANGLQLLGFYGCQFHR